MVIAKTYIFSSKYSNIYGDENLRDIFGICSEFTNSWYA